MDSMPFRRWFARTRRGYVKAATEQAMSSSAPFPYDLLLLAGQLAGESRYQLAVIVAQTACEVLAARVLGALMTKSGLGPGLKRWIDECKGRNSNLGNPAVRTLYQALSGDRIDTQPFWEKYKAHTKLRNRIVHGGATATQQEAQASLRATQEL